jgi:hypothetical protein
MDKNFLNEIMERRNDLVIKGNIKKINPNHTIKMESFNKKDGEYLSICDENYDILSNISKKNTIIEGNVKLILIDTKNNNEKLDEIKRISNSTFIDTNKNSKGFVYLGLFVFLSQVIITGINNYLMLEVFNND